MLAWREKYYVANYNNLSEQIAIVGNVPNHVPNHIVAGNATHIANAELRPRVEQVCRERGYPPPVLCTPDELMGESDD